MAFRPRQKNLDFLPTYFCETFLKYDFDRKGTRYQKEKSQKPQKFEFFQKYIPWVCKDVLIWNPVYMASG